MTRLVLDTNIISGIVRENSTVLRHFRAALEASDEFILCPVAWHECVRGLKHNRNQRAQRKLTQIAGGMLWLDLDREDWSLAADLWVVRTRAGRPVELADLLIAAFARNRDATLVTNNTKDFDLLDVTLMDWTA